MANGKTVEGTVPVWVGSSGGKLLVKEYADQHFTQSIAEWIVDNPSRAARRLR